MIKMGKAICILSAMMCVVLFGISHAEADYVSDGHAYKLTCNENGHVLTSVWPVIRMTGQGAGTQFVELKKEKLYLGRKCDAHHKLYGNGTWCWANGGFEADFGDIHIGFARQELICEKDYGYELECSCTR